MKEKLYDNAHLPPIIKNILIIGESSYIGSSVADYLSEYPEYYRVEILKARGLIPKRELFEGYDVLIDAAGIAHIKETEDNKQLYFDVNRDFTIKIAKAAKLAGVKHFILLSSMSVYGKLVGHITKETVEKPINAYGESKLQADKEIQMMSDNMFKVAILRPPMVYGKGCKGNYQTIRKCATQIPIFPNFNNERSMVFIGNLCEFIKCVIDNNDSGVFFPQNKEYVKTSSMVRSIARQHNKRIHMTSLFSFIIKVIPMSVVKKVFGTLTYEKVDFIEKYNFKESMELTEGYE